MLIIWCYLVFEFVLAAASVAQPLMGLQGLDRLYFEHVGGKEDRSEVPSFMVELLPARIQVANFSARKTVREVQW